jgi:hypothetical protein
MDALSNSLQAGGEVEVFISCSFLFAVVVTTESVGTVYSIIIIVSIIGIIVWECGTRLRYEEECRSRR